MQMAEAKVGNSAGRPLERTHLKMWRTPLYDRA